MSTKFSKPIEELKKGQIISNVLKVINHDEKAISFKIDILFPANWTSIGDATRLYTANPKDTIIIPIIILPTKLVNGNTEVLINVFLVDEDGNNLLDNDGNQVINYGLKTEKKRIVKQQASGLLAPTDWYVVKSTEVADYDVPANILSFRSDVRSKSNEMETQINDCTTVEQLETLYTYTTDEDGVQSRPLAEFPKEI